VTDPLTHPTPTLHTPQPTHSHDRILSQQYPLAGSELLHQRLLHVLFSTDL
jgi:hypothetical protein